MTVRAKFKVDSIERTLQSMPTDEKDENGRPVYKAQEMQTVKMTPVYANNDPEHENSKFWRYSPSGSLTLGTVNAEAAKEFEIGKEYYVDFTAETIEALSDEKTDEHFCEHGAVCTECAFKRDSDAAFDKAIKQVVEKHGQELDKLPDDSYLEIPTVGRAVHYYRKVADLDDVEYEGPLAAIVCEVTSLEGINLRYFTKNGSGGGGRLNVRHKAGRADDNAPYWVWPPRV